MKRWKYERPKWEKQRIREEKKEERKTGKKTKTKRGKKKTREEISRQNSFNRRRSCRQNNEVKNSTKKKDGKRRREKHKKEHEHNEEYEDKQDVEQAWKIRRSETMRSYWCWFVVNVNVFDIHCSPNSAQFSILLVAYIIRVIHWLTDINSKVFYLILCELYMYVLTSCWSCLMGHAFGVDNCNYWRYTNLYCYCFNE